MSLAMNLAVIQDYMPNGYIENVDDIYDKMFIKYNHNEPYIRDTVLNLYEDIFEKTNRVPTFGELVEECEIINCDCITQLAINNCVDYLSENGMELEEISQEEFDEMVEENEYGIMDAFSYNDEFNVEQTLMEVSEKEGVALVISPCDNFYDDLTYGYNVDDGRELEIILNHAQQVMFPELYNVDDVERVTDSSLFKYSDVYIEKEAKQGE